MIPVSHSHEASSGAVKRDNESFSAVSQIKIKNAKPFELRVANGFKSFYGRRASLPSSDEPPPAAEPEGDSDAPIEELPDSGMP